MMSRSEEIHKQIDSLKEEYRAARNAEKEQEKTSKEEAGKLAIGKFFKTIYNDNSSRYHYYNNEGDRGAIVIYYSVRDDKSLDVDLYRSSYGLEEIGTEVLEDYCSEISEEEFTEMVGIALTELTINKFEVILRRA